jgi:hypothetical protein
MNRVGCYLKDSAVFKSSVFWSGCLDFIIKVVNKDAAKKETRKIKTLVEDNYEMMRYCLAGDKDKIFTVAKDVFNISDGVLSCLSGEANLLETFMQEAEIRLASVTKGRDRTGDSGFYQVLVGGVEAQQKQPVVGGKKGNIFV